MFGLEWIFYISAINIILFLVLVAIKSLFLKKLDPSKLSAGASGGIGILATIISICIGCAVSVLGFLGFLFNFPPEIVALLLGTALFTISDLTAKHFEKKEIAALPFITNLIGMSVGILILFLLYGSTGSSQTLHYHADLKVYVNGEPITLYTPQNIEKDNKIHFHDGGNQTDVIHFHLPERKGTIQDFFNTLNFNLSTYNCTQYFLIVNNIFYPTKIDDYIVNDLDRILITCFNNNISLEEIKKEWLTVGNLSCIQSEKCLN